jgi:hypothetical protein
MIPNYKVAEMLKSFGYEALPSDCHFIVLDSKCNEELVVTPARQIFYIKSDDDGELELFKAM